MKKISSLRPLEKDYQTLGKETKQAESQELNGSPLPTLLNETVGKNHYLQYLIYQEFYQAIGLLHSITELRQTEYKEYPDDLSTSFVAVETEIAKCISALLPDVPKPKRTISRIRELLRNYRVVVPVQSQNPSVSLDRVHAILEDNFSNSFLNRFFGLFFKGAMNVQTKVITFF